MKNLSTAISQNYNDVVASSNQIESKLEVVIDDIKILIEQGYIPDMLQEALTKLKGN